MADHALYSPSKLGAWELCPRFDYREFASAASDEGTLMHKAYETGDLSKLDDEQAFAVQQVIDYTNALKAAHPGIRELREERVDIPGLTWGRADCVLISGASAEVLDAKFGRKSVAPAEDNLQLLCYAVGLMYSYPEIEEARVHIIAPRQQDGVTVGLVPRSKIPGIRARIEKVIQERSNAFTPPRCNVDLCQTCAHAKYCPALNKAMVPVQAAALPAVPVDVNRLLTTDVLLLSSEDKARLFALMQVLEDLAEQKKQAITQQALAGEAIPHFTVVRRAGKASVIDVKAAFDFMKETMPASEVLSAMSISLPKLAEAYAAYAGVSAAKGRETVNATLEGLIETGPETRFLQRQRGFPPEKIFMGASRADSEQRDSTVPA